MDRSTQELRSSFLNEVGDVIPPKTDTESLDECAHDKSHHNEAARAPLLVVEPETAEQVAKVVQWCNKHRCPVIARGGGTGLEGAAIPLLSNTVILHMKKFREFSLDAANLSCWVGVGLHKLELGKLLAKEGFIFGPDPSSNPCIGGMASTSGSGMSTLKYGTMRENVLSLEVVTAQGEIIRETRRAVRKSSTGLELTQLYVGSEGTLGIITRICVKVCPLQRNHVGGLATFPTTVDAVKAIVKLRQTKRHITTLVRCELLNVGCVIASNQEYDIGLEHLPTVLMELEDNTAPTSSGEAYGPLKKDFEELIDLFKQYKMVRSEFTPKRSDMDKIWEARRGCLYAALKFRKNFTGPLKNRDKMYNTDTCVPLTNLAQCLQETEEDFERTGFPCIICAHIADGNFHCMLPFRTEAEKKLVDELEHRLSARALRLGGTVSGEHGVGCGKVKHLIGEHGPVHVDVQWQIKKALDPNLVLNPSKFYPQAAEAAVEAFGHQEPGKQASKL